MLRSGTMIDKYDLIVVGAGPVGCVISSQAARVLDWKCLIIEKRPHLAGNCFDRVHSTGLLVHEYGPHYFRTNNDSLIKYLSQFTEWIAGNYQVQASIRGELFPFPINLNTLEKYFKRSFKPEEAKAFLEKERSPVGSPRNSEEFVLSRVGKRLYEDFYLGYTLKQWGLHPKDLDPSVCGRIPLRFNRDDRYVDHKHQVLPKDGFTEMFRRMTTHPNIEIKLDTDFFSIREQLKPRKAMVYSGPVDAYFDFRFGKLGWRSIDFQWQEFPVEYKQPCAQVNFPSENAYTRSVEIKHATGQKNARTVISYETPRAEGDPYYPVPTSPNHELYLKYRGLAEAETRKNGIYFCGRLATYRYINTDEVIESALEMFETIKKERA